jgi:hypothetical protein
MHLRTSCTCNLYVFYVLVDGHDFDFFSLGGPDVLTFPSIPSQQGLIPGELNNRRWGLLAPRTRTI